MTDNPERNHLLQRGIWTETASLIYNLTEVGVSLTAGFLTGSSALISWGVDSLVEAGAAGTLIWRLRGERDGIGPEAVAKRKRVSLGVLSAAFAIAVVFISFDAVGKLLTGGTPKFAWYGIAILVTSLVVNPLLAWAKYHYGKKLESPALKYDAIDTMICEYQTVVVLIGLGLTYAFGWTWADPAAALLIVPYVAWESFEAARDAWNVEPEAAGDDDKEENQ